MLNLIGKDPLHYHDSNHRRANLPITCTGCKGRMSMSQGEGVRFSESTTSVPEDGNDNAQNFLETTQVRRRSDPDRFEKTPLLALTDDKTPTGKPFG